MSRLEWNTVGQRFYDTGVNRGVLYIADQPGVPWLGLTSVTESPSGGDPTPYYVDGIKYLNVPTTEEFVATLTAFTYPEEFAQCDGTAQPRTGLFIAQQSRTPFGLSYRTIVGNDQADECAQKIHIVYNASAAPTERGNKTLSDSADSIEFSWNLTTTAPIIAGYLPSSHIVIDSRYTDPVVYSAVEDILYGTDSTSARIPGFTELVDLYDNPVLTVIDNGDGTFTANGPDSSIAMLDSATFTISWPTAIFIDANTFTISS